MPDKKVAPPLAKELIAYITNLGLQISRQQLSDRLGVKKFKSFQSALTTTEKKHPGQKNIFQRKVRRAFYYLKLPKEGAGRATKADIDIVIPRVTALEGRVTALKGRASKLLLSVVDKFVRRRVLPPPLTIPAKYLTAGKNKPYDYQEAAVAFFVGAAKKIGNTLTTGGNGVSNELKKVDATPEKMGAMLGATWYLKMSAGLGKTGAAWLLIRKLKVKTLIVVPSSTAIGKQWMLEGDDFAPDLRKAVYHNRTKSNPKTPPSPETHDVVIIVINTFRAKKPEFMKGFGLTIFDEAHELHSAKNLDALWLAQTRFVLGLSASPEERPDGLDKYVMHHLGAPIRQEDIPGFSIEDARFRGEVWKIEYAGHPDYCETEISSTGMVSANGTISNFIADPHRLQLIAKTAHDIHMMAKDPKQAKKYGLGKNKQHGIFIFAEHRDFLPIIREALLVYFKADEILAPEISVLRGGISDDEFEKAKNSGAHIALITYGWGRRGISMRDMTVLISASPRRNGEYQLIHRIMRRGSDQNIIRIRVDIVDTRTALKSQWSDRQKTYKALDDYKIIVQKTSYEDFPVAPPKKATKKITSGDDDYTCGTYDIDMLYGDSYPDDSDAMFDIEIDTLYGD